MGSSPDIAAIRRFGRFYSRQIGLLEETLLRSPYSLAEARVLWEIAQRDGVTATEIGAQLNLDAGYLSRMLRDFEQRKLIRRKASKADARQSLLSLTRAGRKAFQALDVASNSGVEKMLAPLTEEDRRRLVSAMDTVERLLAPGPRTPKAFSLRPHRSGDIGWVVERHGVLYNQEYGFDQTFEATVAEIAAKFIRDIDPARERSWIAEVDGERVGSVFLVRHAKQPGTAQLRLLLVEPSARGMGIASKLVAECTAFAREVGYRKIRLWTNSLLTAARRIYEQEGYRLVEEEPHHSYGQQLVGQTWELDLTQPESR
ncbi:MAG: helix-turn-helix domain-containing GNAT family N-acetyltransferase [Bryobacteraceae bacterium]